MVTRYDVTVTAFGVAFRPRRTKQFSRISSPVRAKRRTPRRSVREAVQPHARNQNEREVLEDSPVGDHEARQITIVFEAQT
jgi:hypothetical protein